MLMELLPSCEQNTKGSVHVLSLQVTAAPSGVNICVVSMFINVLFVYIMSSVPIKRNSLIMV